jgi:hypothetical protein
MSNLPRPPHAAALCGVLLALAALPAQALVSLNDGRDKFYVSGVVAVTHDTNFYANSYGYAESILSGTVTGEYSRRAGEIGVDASMGVKMASHLENPEENYQNPFFKAELTKGTGRTTGSLLVSASRESDNDAAANLRTRSWNYNSELNLHYPVIERYSLSGGVGYAFTDYQDKVYKVDGKDVRVMYDLGSFSARADLNYSINSQREFIAGYRFRTELSQGPNDYYDNDFNVGLKGRLLPKLTGTVRVGWQFRNQKGGAGDNYSGLSASAATTWVPTKQTSVTAQVLKDFRTTSTDIASDIVTGTLQANRVLNPQWSAGAGVSAGRTHFLGAGAKGRSDDFSSVNAQISYSPNEHLRVTYSYTFFNNNSTLGFADYDRNLFALSVSSRW